MIYISFIPANPANINRFRMNSTSYWKKYDIYQTFTFFRESGVRNLRKQIEKIYRKVAFKVRNLLGLAINRTFGSDSDPYKNPLKNKAD